MAKQRKRYFALGADQGRLCSARASDVIDHVLGCLSPQFLSVPADTPGRLLTYPIRIGLLQSQCLPGIERRETVSSLVKISVRDSLTAIQRHGEEASIDGDRFVGQDRNSASMCEYWTTAAKGGQLTSDECIV